MSSLPPLTEARAARLADDILGHARTSARHSGFELQAFFTFSQAERELIGARRGESLKLGLALRIGFLRMSGRVLDAFRIVPPALWRVNRVQRTWIGGTA